MQDSITGPSTGHPLVNPSRHKHPNFSLQGVPAQSDWKLICETSLHDESPFSAYAWVTYTTMAVLVIIFAVPLVYVIVRREYPEMRARSPMMTAICIGLLMADAILNTLIISVNQTDPASNFLVCFISVWTTMCINVPILMTMYLRVYRLKRVF